MGKARQPDGNAHDPQLVAATDLGAIYDQANLTDRPGLGFQQVPVYRLIPFTHSHAGIRQQPAQAASDTRHLRPQNGNSSAFGTGEQSDSAKMTTISEAKLRSTVMQTPLVNCPSRLSHV